MMTEQLPVVVAVVNTKGGVGKTTTAVNLGAALASAGRRVLLVDLDSQASASIWCGIRPGRLKPSAASVLLHDFPIGQAIRSTATKHLDILPGSIDLASADLALADVRGRESTLRHALEPLGLRYELIVLDCPPSLSLIAVNALVAASGIVIPIPPQPLALEGLGQLMGSIETVRRRVGGDARILGILITMAGPDTNHGAALRERLRAEYRDRIFHTEIAASRALQEAPGSSETIFQHAPRSRAADAFRRLAGEVLERLRTVRH
jgi:chromosome partitioning protein